MNCKKVMVVYGTRPEVIKMAPVVRELRAHPTEFEAVVCSSGQHVEMLRRLATYFDIEPDVDLGLMGAGGGLAGFMARALEALDGALESVQPDAVLVQGDTTTAVAAALASFYRRIPVGHVEAGLRTGERYSPFPEEVHRQMVVSLATWNFAPTARPREPCRREGVPPDHDPSDGEHRDRQPARVAARPDAASAAPDWLPADRRLVLVTAHRRESFGEPLRGISCMALGTLAERVPDIEIVFPVHMNPDVPGDRAAHPRGGRPRIVLIDRSGIPEFAAS